jgi:hypothetical protein
MHPVQAGSEIENVGVYNYNLREGTLFKAGVKSSAFQAVTSFPSAARRGRVSGRISVQ